MIPQILYLLLVSMGLGIVLSQHGEPKEGEYNFYVTLTVAVVESLILYWGGFFDVFFS